MKLGKKSLLGIGASALLAAAVCITLGTKPAAAADACDPKDLQPGDVAGCQPGVFDVPVLKIPSRRINAQGKLDPTASEADVRAGATLVEDQLGLIRNFQEVHWVTMTPSVKDEKTGKWSGGDLDSAGDGRALTIAGKCLFAGHSNSAELGRPMEIFRIQDDPIKNPPKLVGQIPALHKDDDDSIMGAHLFTKANGQQAIIVSRDISTDTGGLVSYEINPANCQVVKTSEFFDYGGDMHEMGMWLDPNNPQRALIASSASGGAGRPDPYRPGKVTPDIRVLAITDEKTGELLPRAIPLAYFKLQDVGGPVQNEKADENGLFADGRFVDYSRFKNWNGTAIAPTATQSNNIHQVTWAPDGKRIYVAGNTNGFFIVNTEAIAKSTNAALAAGTAGCNFDSTNVYVNGVIGGRIDPAQMPKVATDCIHMVIFDDPGMKALAKAGNILAWSKLQDRSRYDSAPPLTNTAGFHSAIPVPGRPSNDVANTDNSRPADVLVSTETGFCPSSFMYLMNVEVEEFPTVVGTMGQPQNEFQNCITETSTKEADGTDRKNLSCQNHNPTVFKNLVFVTWYCHGLRVYDISNPYNIREVAHFVPAPWGQARSYAVFDHGLIYYMDNGTGIHIVRYTGPRANEIPTDAVYQGNDVKHQ